MKLYYFKGACSLAPHIVLEELQLPHELVAVDFQNAPSEDFIRLNPMGAVPVLVLDDGTPLTEGAAIMQYLADRKPEAGLAPKPGTIERVRLQEWLNFISTEIHKGFSPLFGVDYITENESAKKDIINHAVKELGRRFDIIALKLGQREYLMPSGYTVADAYLYTVLNWTKFLKVDMSRWPTLLGYMERIKARPGTIRALKAEHLM